MELKIAELRRLFAALNIAWDDKFLTLPEAVLDDQIAHWTKRLNRVTAEANRPMPDFGYRSATGYCVFDYHTNGGHRVIRKVAGQ